MNGRFLGIDGGGTKTEFVCIDAGGHEIATATLGTTYHLEIGVEEAVRRLGQGVRTITDRLGIGPDAFDFVFFGLPAYGEDRRIDPVLAAAAGRLLGHDRYRCDNDMVCGWAGSLGAADGINIVAGTGSIGYGERQGRAARAGGWGELIGDEGSGYWIARQGLAAFSRMSDGRLARGPLHDGLRTVLALGDDLELCEQIMGERAMSRTDLAALAPHVAAAAALGDLAAVSILERAADHLFDIARALRTRLGYPADEGTAVSGSGSILTWVPAVRDRFIALLRLSEEFDWVAPRHSPAHGAALYARKLARAPAPAG